MIGVELSGNARSPLEPLKDGGSGSSSSRVALEEQQGGDSEELLGGAESFLYLDSCRKLPTSEEDEPERLQRKTTAQEDICTN